jgi:hypothetical protein
MQFREISYLKGIFQAQDNEMAKYCLGTHFQPTVRRAPVARATAFWTSGGAAGFLKVLQQH